MGKIQWTDRSVNPIYIKREDGSNGGHWCKKKSEGCGGCYAEEINQSDFFSFASHLTYTGNPPAGLQFDDSILASLPRMRSSKKHFICSMTDLFGEWVDREWQFKVFDIAVAAPKQTLQLLTKRPEIAVVAAREWCIDRDRLCLPENCWMGVSVENQRCADERREAWREMSLLVKPKSGVTWVSYEPALEAIDWTGWESIKWMVIGGESGSEARMFNIAWAKSAIDWGRTWGVAPFFKQAGSNAVEMVSSHRVGEMFKDPDLLLPFRTSDRKGGNIEEFPKDLQVREFPQVGVTA